jgi:hypothetical protein
MYGEKNETATLWLFYEGLWTAPEERGYISSGGGGKNVIKPVPVVCVSDVCI